MSFPLRVHDLFRARVKVHIDLVRDLAVVVRVLVVVLVLHQVADLRALPRARLIETSVA
jgi:hypothetical protein